MYMFIVLSLYIYMYIYVYTYICIYTPISQPLIIFDQRRSSLPCDFVENTLKFDNMPIGSETEVPSAGAGDILIINTNTIVYNTCIHVYIRLSLSLSLSLSLYIHIYIYICVCMCSFITVCAGGRRP